MNIVFRDLLTSDVYLSFTTLYWSTGWLALIRGTIDGLTRIITTDAFAPDLMLRLIEKYSVTVTLTAPYHVALLLQCPTIVSANLSTVRMYLCGGSSVAHELLLKINQLLPIGLLIAYGMTECLSSIAANEDRYKDSVGALSDGMMAQIVDDDGRRQGPNEDGEICLKPPFTFVGYYNNAEATAGAVDADGWLHTGDVGFFDEHGFLFMVDRKKDIIKYRNWQIAPNELENIILRCNGVAGVCVVGVPDDVSIDLPAAVIVKQVGGDVDIEEIKAVIKSNY